MHTSNGREIKGHEASSRATIVVTHQMAIMEIMKGSVEGFCQRVCRVDKSRDVLEDDVAISFPFLQRKMLNVNMPRTWSGSVGVDHHKDIGRILVLV